MEIWKDIKDYEGLYQVSNLGNIRKIKFINNKVQKDKIFNIKPQMQNKGYLKVCLYKNNKMKNKLLHRIVAETFIENAKGYKEINHKDGNKLNNCVENLDWCNRNINMQHAVKKGLWVSPNKNLYGGNNPKAIKVKMIDKTTNMVIKTFDSIIEATHYVGKTQSGHIVNCCKGKLKTAYGFKWRYNI